MTVQELLYYLFAGGGAGAIVSWWMDRPIMVRFRAWLGQKLEPVLGVSEVSRYIAMLLSGVITVAAYAAAAALSYVAWPAGIEGWLNLFLDACYVYLISQVVHARRHLRRVP